MLALTWGVKPRSRDENSGTDIGYLNWWGRIWGWFFTYGWHSYPTRIEFGYGWVFFPSMGNLMGTQYFTIAMIKGCEQVKICVICYLLYLYKDTHYQTFNAILLTWKLFTLSTNLYLSHVTSLHPLPHHLAWYKNFKIIYLTHMIFILNYVFTILFYAMRWTKLYHTCICFEQFLNQLILLYK
jgi:hypothetical protein